MQDRTKFARLVVGGVGLLSAAWSAILAKTGLPTHDPDLLAAIISGCGIGFISSAFLVIVSLFPGRISSLSARQHEVLPAEGGKDMPVDRPQFRIPLAVLPLCVVLIAGLMGGLQLVSLPWHIANGINPMAAAILAAVGMAGAVAFFDSIALIRVSFSNATR